MNRIGPKRRRHLFVSRWLTIEAKKNKSHIRYLLKNFPIGACVANNNNMLMVSQYIQNGTENVGNRKEKTNSCWSTKRILCSLLTQNNFILVVVEWKWWCRRGGYWIFAKPLRENANKVKIDFGGKVYLWIRVHYFLLYLGIEFDKITAKPIKPNKSTD